MSRLQEEMRVVPTTGKIIAVLVALAMSAGMAYLVYVAGGEDFRSPGNWPLRPLMIVIAPALVGIYLLMVGYIYGDAKRRRMRHVLWTFLALLLPQALGIILYFILRDPLPSSCPKCQAAAPSNYTFCPFCGTELKPTCPNCGRSVDASWANCAFCGRKLQPGANAA